jgi:alpha-galactosidase
MPGPLKRRDFIRSVSLAGATVIANNGAATIFSADNIEIKNEFFTISFKRGEKVFDITRKNGMPLLTGGAAFADFKPGKQPVFSADRKYSFSTGKFSSHHGSGNKLIIFSKDRNKQADFEVHLSLYDNFEAVSVEVFCKNISRQHLIATGLNAAGILHMPGVSKCLTNGEMYFDAGSIHDFDKGPADSWWNVGLFSGYDKESTVLGYLENYSGLGKFSIARNSPGELAFIASSVFEPQLALQPGATIRSDRLMICLAANPYAALEQYATISGKARNARTSSVLNGWCSWFYTLSKVSEQEVVNNTIFAATHLKPYGLEYIQIDEGYQRWHGHWDGNERFPHGMKWLADIIKSHGFKAGIWISPYVISEPTEVFQKHPEWLVKGDDGKPQRVGNWPPNTAPPADENPKRYCLDITHPGAAQWLHDLIHKIVNEWGYEMIKIDFVAWSILAAKNYYDPAVSSAEVYRKGMEIMRKAAGEKCHILECGPGNITSGLIDSMRIELDVYYGFNEAAWNTYFLHPAGSAAAAGKRYYFHKRTWVNDVDHVCMDLLNNQQAEAAATIIALSGGNMFSGDRLTQLDPYKLEILKKITPSSGEAAKPVDLFDADIQSVFVLKVNKPFAEWTIAGFFNASLTEKQTKKYSPDRLWLDRDKTYLIFDFWNQQFIGEISEEIKIDIEPGSVRLLSVHEKTGRPQFVSTDRHVAQGALELENCIWNEDTKTLSGISVGALHTSHNVFIYVPQEQPWTWDGSALYRDQDMYSIKLVDKHIIRIHVRFEQSGRVNWQLSF